MIKNTSENFGLVSIALHWIVAVLMIGLIILGLYMTQLPISSEKLKLYGWHKEYGLLVLWLAIARLWWQVININPSLASLPDWERWAARSAHWAFYGFMFAMPITGWMVTSASGLPVSFFGWFVMPNFVPVGETYRHLFTLMHQWIGYALILTIAIHTGAALKHQWINKDNILRRMLWPLGSRKS